MSTIRVDNFGPSAGGTTYSARGIAKSWVNFDGTGTIAIRDSENVASLTDNGTGDYSVNFSDVFADANYTVIAKGTRANDRITQDNCTDFSRSTSSSRIVATGTTGGGLDRDTISSVLNGDLA